VIATHTFEKAVKRYRHRIRRRPRPRDTFAEPSGDNFLPFITPSSSTLSPLTISTADIDIQTQMKTRNFHLQGCAQRKLEALPFKVLSLTKTFHEHVWYLLGPGTNDKDTLKMMPIGLKRLLCEITDAEIGAEIQEEILQDEDARRVSVVSTCVMRQLRHSPLVQTFFIVSIEREFLPLSS
jgi:hypothetical protein